MAAAAFRSLFIGLCRNAEDVYDLGTQAFEIVKDRITGRRRQIPYRPPAIQLPAPAASSEREEDEVAEVEREEDEVAFPDYTPEFRRLRDMSPAPLIFLIFVLLASRAVSHVRSERLCSEVYLYGGHVTSWKNILGEELLFVSSKAIFKPSKPIRGGIPICFPQFSNHGPLEAHGFARNRLWIVDPEPPALPTNPLSKAYVDLLLKPTPEDLKIWPHSFEFRLRVSLGLGGDLMLTSRVRNIDTKPFSFTFAYHNYFSVSAISEVRVEGLETLDYLDNLENKERFTEQGDAITFEKEVDKIYLSLSTKIAILDHERKRTFVIRQDGLPDAVVWNPWDKKAKAQSDFRYDEYKHMLCVEPAAIEKSITLKPGEEWRGRQELSAVLSSYCSGQLDPHKVLQSYRF